MSEHDDLPEFCKKESSSYDVARCQRFKAQRRTRSDQRDPASVQTLIFDQEFWSFDRAVGWAREHGFMADKVDETENSFRLRQQQPGVFQPESFRTIDFMGVRGIKAVIGRRK